MRNNCHYVKSKNPRNKKTIQDPESDSIEERAGLNSPGLMRHARSQVEHATTVIWCF